MHYCKFCATPFPENATTCRVCGRARAFITVPFAKETSAQAQQNDVKNPLPPKDIHHDSTFSDAEDGYPLWELDTRPDLPGNFMRGQYFSQVADQTPFHSFYTPTPLSLKSQRSQEKGITFRSFRVFIVVLILFVGVFSASGYLLNCLTPLVSLVEASHGTIGDILHMHGQNFLADTKVVLTRDTTVPLDVSVRATYQDEQTQNGVQVVPKQLATVSGNVLTLGDTGTFDVTIIITNNWSVGIHRIRASEVAGLLYTEISFHVYLPPKTNS